MLIIRSLLLTIFALTLAGCDGSSPATPPPTSLADKTDQYIETLLQQLAEVASEHQPLADNLSDEELADRADAYGDALSRLADLARDAEHGYAESDQLGEALFIYSSKLKYFAYRIEYMVRFPFMDKPWRTEHPQLLSENELRKRTFARALRDSMIEVRDQLQSNHGYSNEDLNLMIDALNRQLN
jgi:hypothetical protein